jgi:hypothetical protein
LEQTVLDQPAAGTVKFDGIPSRVCAHYRWFSARLDCFALK